MFDTVLFLSTNAQECKKRRLKRLYPATTCSSPHGQQATAHWKEPKDYFEKVAIPSFARYTLAAAEANSRLVVEKSFDDALEWLVGELAFDKR